ncbi:MAG TPA: hypothetical protein VH062_36165 [Polyangiaceae bacterium]|jgi:hypothetical protein|nr:hypothetical protein [Polyangiaceae bacterium]
MGRELAPVASAASPRSAGGSSSPKAKLRGAKAPSFLAVLIAAAGFIACARPVDHTESPHALAPLGSSGDAPGAPSVAWAKKSREQRMEFMGLTFHPRMRELFQAYDGAAYGKFRCQSCHGEDMEARSFAMPATLRPLPAVDAARAGNVRDARATKFMVEAVLPATISLLASDRAESAPITCASCHAAE